MWEPPGVERHRTCSAPGIVPAAHMTIVLGPACRCTAPMTSASEGRVLAALCIGAAMALSVALNHSSLDAKSGAGARWEPSALPRRSRTTLASPTIGMAPCFDASWLARLTDASFRAGFAKAVQLPEVKSGNRVPKPTIKSAVAHSLLAQSLPVTPGEPKFSGSRQLLAPLPAWVST